MTHAMPSQQRIALVTGAAKGIGAAIAERLAHDGMQVLIGDIDEAQARVKADELTQAGLSAAPLLLDVGDAASVAAAFEAIDIMKLAKLAGSSAPGSSPSSADSSAETPADSLPAAAVGGSSVTLAASTSAALPAAPEFSAGEIVEAVGAIGVSTFAAVGSGFSSSGTSRGVPSALKSRRSVTL